MTTARFVFDAGLVRTLRAGLAKLAEALRLGRSFSRSTGSAQEKTMTATGGTLTPAR